MKIIEVLLCIKRILLSWKLKSYWDDLMVNVICRIKVRVKGYYSVKFRMGLCKYIYEIKIYEFKCKWVVIDIGN